MSIAKESTKALELDGFRPVLAEASAIRRAVRRLCFAPLKLVWRLTRPIRRPMVAKFDHRIVQLMGSDFRALSEQIDRLSIQVAEANSRHLDAVREMNLFVEGMVREVARMQTQILTMSQHYAHAAPSDCPPAAWHEAKEFSHAP